MAYRAILFGIVFTAIFGFSARAENRETIQQFYQKCKSTIPETRMTCLDFIDGLSAMMTFESGAVRTDRGFSKPTREALSQFSMCSEDTITLGQLAQVFTNWVEKNPQLWQRSSLFGVWSALKEAWPCVAN